MIEPYRSPLELIVSFMERHGDIMHTSKHRLKLADSAQKWIELTDLLNEKSPENPRTIEKWKKCWTDFKNNTKRKVCKLRKIKETKGSRSRITDLEKRVLKLMGDRAPKETAESDVDDVIMLIEAKDPDQPEECENTSSLLPSFFRYADVEATREKSSASSSVSTKSSSKPTPQPEQSPHSLRETDVEATRQRNSSTSSSSTSSHTEPPPAKRKKRFKDNMKDMTEIYLEFERERARMAHEREMARIQQNDQLITICGRIVNVLESLAPSVHRYLDCGNNDEG